MNQTTVLVIDDSATIRKLVDSQLSSAGYRVVLAQDAEKGLELAAELNPDLILLDHQLPGTTGHSVATRLSQIEELCHIPVVISSTLRKKAYAEYVDLDNVVDMLPKPYTEELLRTTVANAIETAAMIVNSQSQGGAVPEIIHAMQESALSGNLNCFSLRELIDFLNNGGKVGVLEVEAGKTRIRFHLDQGRIQGVYAQGLGSEEVEQMIARLPQSLSNLAPILKMTLSGKSCTEIEGFVQLLDQKVLDPRLMSKLLRFQASQLMNFAFAQQLSLFQFESGRTPNALHRSLPLEISLLALLVEGALYGEVESQPNANFVYARRAIRGQNLDRTGLSARHMKVFNALSEPKDTEELARWLGWEPEEVVQVLHAFVLAELVERRTCSVAGQFVVFEPNANHAQRLRAALQESDNRYSGKVVRDKLALQLFLKRQVPHTLVFAGDDDAACALIARVFATNHPQAARIKRIALCDDFTNIDWKQRLGFEPEATLSRPGSAEELYALMDELLAEDAGPGRVNHNSTTDPEEFESPEFVSAGTTL